MSKVRVLVGTRKGAFMLTADGARKRWKVSGPHFAGWEIYHVKGSPVDANRIYASQTSAWFGQIIQRSDDGGKTWNAPGSSPEELKGADGGQESQCGWLKDKFGVSWQIVPTVLIEMLQDKDSEKSERVMKAMLQMQKIDIKKLNAAYAGK